MDEAQRAQQLVDDWANTHVLPRLLEFLASHSFATITIVGIFGQVQIRRNLSGKACISYLNPRMRQALTHAFHEEEYQLTDGDKEGKKFVLLITPKV